MTSPSPLLFFFFQLQPPLLVLRLPPHQRSKFFSIEPSPTAKNAFSAFAPTASPFRPPPLWLKSFWMLRPSASGFPSCALEDGVHSLPLHRVRQDDRSFHPLRTSRLPSGLLAATDSPRKLDCFSLDFKTYSAIPSRKHEVHVCFWPVGLASTLLPFPPLRLKGNHVRCCLFPSAAHRGLSRLFGSHLTVPDYFRPSRGAHSPPRGLWSGHFSSSFFGIRSVKITPLCPPLSGYLFPLELFLLFSERRSSCPAWKSPPRFALLLCGTANHFFAFVALMRFIF